MNRLVFLSILILGLLSGCGFQLRGTATPLPKLFEKTYFMNAVVSDDHFERKIKNLLMLNGGEIVAKARANVAIQVSNIRVYSRQIAESANGATKEYERRYNAVVTVTDLKSGAQLGSREVSVTRNIQLTDSQVLAGEEQSRVTKANAESALAQAVMRYLKTF